MSRSKWRAHSARVINQVLTQQPGLSVAEARKAIAAAYPFGERKMWPYHCWLLGYLRGVGHRWQPAGLPWIDLGTLWPPAVCPAVIDLAGAISWHRNRLLRLCDAYEATKALSRRWPWR